MVQGLQIDLRGRTALVTGASRGIGRSIAETLAQCGADIVGIGTNLKSAPGDLAEAIAARGRRFTAIDCDLGERSQLAALIKRLADRQIDILINNAGIIRRAPAAEHAIEDWDAVMAVNCDAPFLLTQALGREMLKRGSGKVVFVASVLSYQGGINVPGYAASKGAVAQLVKAFANEWASQGVNVNGVAPGYVATDNTAALQADSERERALLERVPAGRWGRPTEIAEPVAFLCSDLARFIHGTILPVDGGWLSR
ncbi:SDR family oxidoreductase [Pseudohoeflea coraliihabitans]|uniref:SDR family oxidoreductase n=1 Tax=Pseudohoeflea coraliihabitans TaxID=2860393 RepID=A0ABS6WSS8_9HYPH|nr:SDR family oxidoreductase [Pseudohoeflea sp. DP4N28-3]MBW3099028.1 SDR family oxidoreductase [Pseudohoeflea sp. DP4N28-3]